jgi:hypothetical protein
MGVLGDVFQIDRKRMALVERSESNVTQKLSEDLMNTHIKIKHLRWEMSKLV